MSKRLETNVEGCFFVNSACIGCTICWQLAPNVFAEVNRLSAVIHQPELSEDKRKAFQALLACPTAAIGSREKDGIAQAINDFPLLIAENVYYCGFSSARSYGGSSY